MLAERQTGRLRSPPISKAGEFARLHRHASRASHFARANCSWRKNTNGYILTTHANTFLYSNQIDLVWEPHCDRQRRRYTLYNVHIEKYRRHKMLTEHGFHENDTFLRSNSRGSLFLSALCHWPAVFTVITWPASESPCILYYEQFQRK